MWHPLVQLGNVPVENRSARVSGGIIPNSVRRNVFCGSTVPFLVL